MELPGICFLSSSTSPPFTSPGTADFFIREVPLLFSFSLLLCFPVRTAISPLECGTTSPFSSHGDSFPWTIRRRASPPGPDRCTAILGELFHRTHIPLNNPVVAARNLNARNLLFHLGLRIHWRTGLGRGKGGWLRQWTTTIRCGCGRHRTQCLGLDPPSAMLEENWVHAPAVVSTGANDKGGSEDSPLCWLGIVIGFDEGEDFDGRFASLGG